MTVDNPEFELPFTLTDDGAAVIEQGSPNEIMQCAYVLLRVEPGEIVEMPTFGVPSQLFRSGGADLTIIAQAITQSDPRAHIVISQDPTWISTLVQRIVIQQGA